ncbi:MAG: exopolyphosphatase/guanosine-5'-triphosphate,3'-diphosphate pyrophosphatase [Alphaproteobacteria bacterium]|jgi:exopolyphosphatase/guanosine-5'-triphosphate,3'-diphosphate pyrophosphatase
MAAAIKRSRRQPTGVLDIGSNSIRLVVFQSRSRAPIPVFNERIICGIGRNLDSTGHLDAEGVERGLASLRRYAALTRAMEVEDLDIVATAATREAADGAEFLAQVEQIFDRPVGQLNGDEEARLGASGVVCGMPDADGIGGDLGGGSLELATLDGGVFGTGHSLPLGHLRLLTDLGSKQRALSTRIDDVLQSADWLPRIAGRRFYAIGGAWRAIARLHMIQSGYPLRVIHGYTLRADRAAEFCQVIAGLSKASLPLTAAVPAQRAAAMPVSAMVLQKLIRKLGPREIVFSALGIREGVLFDRLGKAEKARDPLLLACRDIANRESRFAPGGDSLSEWVAPLFPDEDDAVRRLRIAVCLLADIGWHENPDYRAEQVYFRILRLPLIAITHAEKAKLALAVYRRYGGNMDDHGLRAVNTLLEPGDILWSRTVGDALRLAETLTGGKAALLAGSQLRLGNQRLTLQIDPSTADLVSEVVRNRLSQLASQMQRKYRLSVE